MSFWDLVNGRETDLQPIEDPSLSAALAAPIGGIIGGAAIVIGAAAAAVSGIQPMGIMGFQAGRGVAYATSSADSIPRMLSDLEQAIVTARHQRIRQAIRFYERALSIKPQNPPLLSRLAISYAAIEDLDAAIRIINEVLSMRADCSYYWLQKATFFLQKQDLLGAHAAFLKASELSPEETEAWTGLGFVNQKLGDQKAALICWERVTQLSPKTASGWINRGELAYALGNVQEGVRCWSTACSIEGTLRPPWVVLHEAGNEALAKGELHPATSRFDECIRCNPGYWAPWLGKAHCERKRGNQPRALTFVQEATRLEPNSAKAWFTRGNILSDLGRTSEASESWRRAYSIDSSIGVPWVMAYKDGVRLLSSGDVQAAITAFARAIQSYPQYAEAWFRKGAAHRALRQTNEARQCLKRAIQEDPNHSVALLNAGNLEFELGCREAAIAYWDRALKSNSKLAQAAINKGAALADEGDLDQALLLFTKAAEAGHPIGASALTLCRSYVDMDPSVGPRVI